MGRKKLVGGDMMAIGDILHLVGLKTNMPKVGSWSTELVVRVDRITPLEAKCLWSNIPASVAPGTLISLNRRQWLRSRKLRGEELGKWKLMGDL